MERSIKAIPEWDNFERGLKAFCRCLGTKDSRDVLLTECLQDADRQSRQLVHQFDGSAHVDWRWEYLEYAIEKVVLLFATMVTFFRIEGACV